MKKNVLIAAAGAGNLKVESANKVVEGTDITRSLAITPEKIFLEAKEKYLNYLNSKNEIAKRKASDHFKTLNKRQRLNLHFPILEKNGIYTWQELEAEAERVENKISKLSSTDRDMVLNVHTACLIEYENHLNNGK